MLAVTANLTKVHYGVKHICLSHQRKVDKHHIDESSHLKTNLQYKVTEFNKEICDEDFITGNQSDNRSYNTISSIYWPQSPSWRLMNSFSLSKTN